MMLLLHYHSIAPLVLQSHALILVLQMRFPSIQNYISNSFRNCDYFHTVFFMIIIQILILKCLILEVQLGL
jgi:hypothetical protein